MVKKRKQRPIPDFGLPDLVGLNPFLDAVSKVADAVKELAKAPPPPWRAVLGFMPDEPVTAEEVERRFKARAKIMHPDAGGSHNEMVLLNQAKEEALKACQ